jgi:hypothetical protein
MTNNVTYALIIRLVVSILLAKGRSNITGKEVFNLEVVEMKRKISMIFGMLAFAIGSQALGQTIETVDSIRGGWILDVEDARHIYIFKIRGKDISGIYCTDCSDLNNLSLIDRAEFIGPTSFSFSVYYESKAGDSHRDFVQAELIDGKLVLQGQDSISESMITLIRDTPVIRTPPPGGGAPRPPAPEYIAPGPAELIKENMVLGLWITGTGPDRQQFSFRKSDDGQIYGMVCGPCDSPFNMAPLDGVYIDGTNFHFDLVHEDWGGDFEETGPYDNITDATISRNEMRMSSVHTDVGTTEPLPPAFGMTLHGPMKEY